MKAIMLGDAMIHGTGFKAAWDKYLAPNFGENVIVGDFESNWDKLQYRRLEVEKRGPEIEVVDDAILKEGKDAEMLMGLFVPVSSKVMDAMPKLRIVGVSRGGLENVNIPEATKRGILVFNVKGRNAHAVSDFAVGMMLAETRNIARAFYAIKNRTWQKEFANNGYVPEMHDKTIGIVGFGYIGRLVAQKLSGFNVHIVVYDPFVPAEAIEAAGCKKVELNDLFKESDIVSIHARLTDATKNMVGAEQIKLMKKTAYLINTGRAGLVDQDALIDALKNKRIMGAALDVFTTEPIDYESEYCKLDNVTLTTHIAGTTAEVFSNSPFLLEADIAKFLKGEKASFIVNKEVLDNPDFKAWLAQVK